MKIVYDKTYVRATHPDSQDISGLYPGCLALTVPDGTAVEIGQAWEVTVDEAVAARIIEAAAVCSAVLSSLRSRFASGEELTWQAQLAEAKAILADPTLAEASYPTIAGIIAVTGETAADFAMAVVKNNDDWTAVTANVIGQRQAFVAALKAAAVDGATVADVLAVPLNISLPT